MSKIKKRKALEKRASAFT